MHDNRTVPLKTSKILISIDSNMEIKRTRRSPKGERKRNWISGSDVVEYFFEELTGLCWLYVRESILILFLGVQI